MDVRSEQELFWINIFLYRKGMGSLFNCLTNNMHSEYPAGSEMGMGMVDLAKDDG